MRTPFEKRGPVSRNRWWVALLAMLATAPSAAAGQSASEPAPVVTLAEARRRAASVNPDAVAARGQLETAAWARRAAMSNLVTPTCRGGSYATSLAGLHLGTGG